VTLSAPTPLADHHELAEFDSGVPELDDWLRRRAHANQVGGASRTFVVCEEDRVIAYYALAFGAVMQPEAPGRFRRNMPDPIPVAVLGRLAIDLNYQGRGLGRALVRDAGLRLLNAAEILVSAACWYMQFPMMLEPSMRRSVFYLRRPTP
jgi:GNAT superfamily N-acetyltransferase